jgi:hypothetical protein
MAKLPVAGSRAEHLGPVGGELPAPRDEVGVQVRLRRVGDPQMPLPRCRAQGSQVPARVDGQRSPITEVH